MTEKDCIFCKLANGEIPVPKIFEDEDLAVILDAGPAAQGHALIIPKSHWKNIVSAPEDIKAKLIAVAAKVGDAQMKALGADGFNILINTNAAAGQSVFHVHVHVIPRYDNDNVLSLWTPGEVEDGAGLIEKIKAAMSN